MDDATPPRPFGEEQTYVVIIPLKVAVRGTMLLRDLTVSVQVSAESAEQAVMRVGEELQRTIRREWQPERK